MSNLLTLLDDLINQYRADKGVWPSSIVCNELTKKKILSLYKEDLSFYFQEDKTFSIGDCYCGLPFEIDENEKFVRVK